MKRNQEVTDAQGRRRFHGAFTGGFSAGYYNSVGTEEGWKPQTFSSSRGNRSSRVEQRPEDFMDEEDDPLLGKRLETSERYDTLQTGSKRRLQQQQQPCRARVAAIPGFTLPDDWALPVNDSIGAKLLKQMGWKEGHGIGKHIQRHKFQEDENERPEIIMQDADEEKAQELLQDEVGEKVYVPSRNVFDVQKFFPKPKLDRHGAGFDPYTDAPEFLLYKKQQQEEKEKDESHRREVSFLDALKSSTGSNRATSGYGLSALEENDDVDVYGTVPMAEFDRVVAPLGSNNNIQRIKASAQASYRQRKTRRSRALCSDGRSVLPGFELAVSKEKPPKAVNVRLTVPSGYTAYHHFDKDEDHSDPVTALYRKFNFSADTTCNGMLVTAKQRRAIFADNKNNVQGDTGTVVASVGEVVGPVGSVFDLLDDGQKSKLFDAAKQAKQGRLPLRLVPTALVKEPATLAGQQPLVCDNNSDLFRATISASIAKRFVPSTSPLDEGKHDSAQSDVPQTKLSRRSQDLWIPKALLCKRFHVKCTRPTGSSGNDEKIDKKRDLYNEELVPHLLEYAADRAVHKQTEVTTNKTSECSEVVEVERAETKDLPALPASEKMSASLLKSIFEPSDESDLSKNSSEAESDSGGSDEEREEELGGSKQESPSKLTVRAHAALRRGRDAGESLLQAAEENQKEWSSSEEDAITSTAFAASGRVNEQVNRLRKRSHSGGTGGVKRHAKADTRKHKKHKKHHKHRSSCDSKDKKKDKKKGKSHKRRSSRHSRRSRSAIRSPC